MILTGALLRLNEKITADVTLDVFQTIVLSISVQFILAESIQLIGRCKKKEEKSLS